MSSSAITEGNKGKIGKTLGFEGEKSVLKEKRREEEQFPQKKSKEQVEPISCFGSNQEGRRDGGRTEPQGGKGRRL